MPPADGPAPPRIERRPAHGCAPRAKPQPGKAECKGAGAPPATSASAFVIRQPALRLAPLFISIESKCGCTLRWEGDVLRGHPAPSLARGSWSRRLPKAHFEQRASFAMNLTPTSFWSACRRRRQMIPCQQLSHVSLRARRSPRADGKSTATKVALFGCATQSVSW
jgi:hypothetical protein